MEANQPKVFFFDVESFPNFFCVTFLEKDSRDVFSFSLGCGKNDIRSLSSFLSQNMVLVGYNNISYDNAVLTFIQKSRVVSPETIFELSQMLVDDTMRRDEYVLSLRYPRDFRRAWTYMDLMKIMAFDRMGVSLKQIAINLKHNRIMDLPYAYDHNVEGDEEVETILDYNLNDVHITEKLYYNILPQIKLREEISDLYNVDVTNASDSKMGNIILEHYYQVELGKDPRALRDLRTKRTSVRLSDCIPAVIEFKTPELIALKEKLKSMVVYHTDDFRFEELKINFRGTGYSIGSGGIHSTEGACYYTSTETEEILSCDIASMYPSCIIINKIYPAHLGEDFVKVLRMLTEERLSAKKKNKTKADALKITINGLYGKLRSDTFWLEDALALLRVTIAGQLYILMLVEMLELSGIHCISANTDGIECIVSKDKKNLYYDICKEWEKKTGFILEFTKYNAYIKRDVNNYIAIGEDGKAKTKGAFIPDIDLKKGYKHPIVPRAVFEYFVHGVPVEETILNCKDPLDFCISQKSSADFQMEYVFLEKELGEEPKYSKTIKEQFLYSNGWKKEGDAWTLEGEKYPDIDSAFSFAREIAHFKKSGLKVEKLQKTNRFYISKSGGVIRKKKKASGSITGLFVGQNVRLLNDLQEDTPFEEYDINIRWYINEAKAMIEEIKPLHPQMDMFGGVKDFGRKTKMENALQESLKNKKTKEQKTTIEELKNAPKTRKKYNVSFRYALVTSVNTKYAPVLELYSFANGTGKNIIKVKKPTFERSPIASGDVIFMAELVEKPKVKKVGEEFVEVPGETVWWLESYSVVKDLKDFDHAKNNK